MERIADNPTRQHARLPVGVCWGTSWDATLPELIVSAARHGFGTIAATPRSYRQWLDSGHSGQELRRMLDDHGLRVTTIDPLIRSLPGFPDPADVPASVRDVVIHDEAFCFDMALTLGASLVNVVHYLCAPAPFDELAEAISSIAQRAARHGLRICLEFMPDSGMPDLPSTQALAERVRQPNVGIMLDTWHLQRSGGTAADIRALPPNAISAVQLSDWLAPPPGGWEKGRPFGRWFPGEGQLPLADILNAILTNSPGIAVELEVIGDIQRALPPDEAIARAAKATESWLKHGGAGVRWA